MQFNNFSRRYIMTRYIASSAVQSVSRRFIMTKQPLCSSLQAAVKRNIYADFDKAELHPSPFEAKLWKYTQSPNFNWKIGSGANSDEWKKYKKIAIDPNGEGRSTVDNYRMLISGVVPRPIGFVSTIGKDGKRNLAPFSYFTVVSHDPPVFTIGFTGGKGSPKDTCRNILDTEELTINIISEWFVEAAVYCSMNAPLGVDEWKLSGLTPLESEKVKPPHVAESAFSIEAKLIHSHEWHAKSDPSKGTGVLCIVEGINFHVREDVFNPDSNTLDINKLKPVSQLGGISYARTVEGYEISRPVFAQESEKDEVKKLLE